MSHVRQPAVAGSFYPASASQLAATVHAYLAQAGAQRVKRAPKALIVPHAGYAYSGPVAAAAYAQLLGSAERITRVLLIGPAHYVPIRGIAASGADAFATPLGEVPVDRPVVEALVELAHVTIRDDAHRPEHCLEVQLPFLQTVLRRFTIVPLVVGDAGCGEVRDVIERAWGGSETLIVISSDLSHYHDYDTARRLDAEAAVAILAFESDSVGEEHACGRIPIGGLLLAARTRGLKVVALDLCNSGDTAGPRDHVVGYGAFAFA